MLPAQISSGQRGQFSVARYRPQDLNLSKSEVEALNDVDLVLRPEEVGIDALRTQANRYRTTASDRAGLLPPPPTRARGVVGMARGLEQARPALRELALADGPAAEAAATLLEAARDYERMRMSVETGRAQRRD